MIKDNFKEVFTSLFHRRVELNDNYWDQVSSVTSRDQEQTNSVFSEKWKKYGETSEQENLFEFQKNWYLTLYGFNSEEHLGDFLRQSRVIFDAGCGLGYKAAWFAELAPNSLVIGMDFSDAALQASQRYSDIPNLFFVRGDIASTHLKDSAVDYTSCDQVIMHTTDPTKTFIELSRITEKNRGQVACYFYAKKALPRELLDDYFRVQCKEMTHDDLWSMSESLTELGRRLSELNVSFEAPDIPQLGIKGGHYDIQRFIYWNFLKCFWNPHLGHETSKSTNFDWYSPSNAKRFSKEDVMNLVDISGMKVLNFHSEDAAHSGRFVHKKC